jgi:DTW domain-containing protein YfiP
MSGSVAASEVKCVRCLLPQRVCLCAEIPTVVTRTRVVIIRHYSEHNRMSNTARLAHQALPNSELIDYGHISGPVALPDLSDAWVLYPIGEPTTETPAVLPAKLVVLDASWSKARKMYQKLAVVRGLPVLRLPDGLPMAAQRMRSSPGPGQVSTIEAIAAALRLLEGEAAGGPLDRLFEVAVERANRTGRVNKR